MTEGKENKQKLEQEKKADEKKADSKKSKIKSKNTESEPKSKKDETKLLEEKEHGILEYFSKDELTDKCKDLEREIEDLNKKNKSLSEKLSKEETETKKWKDKYIHLQAEFENAQKRWDKMRSSQYQRNVANVLKSFLPLYDSFQKGLENKDIENENIKGFYNQFMGILKAYDVKPIETKKDELFDYNLHEALSSIEKEDLPNNSIVDVIQEGWMIGKDVLRYSKVIISKKPEPPEPEPEPEPEPKPESELEEINEKSEKLTEEHKAKAEKEQVKESNANQFDPKESVSDKKKEDQQDKAEDKNQEKKAKSE